MVSHRVTGAGCVAIDDRVVVQEYPEADTKILAKHLPRRLGGLSAIALVTVSKLGLEAEYVGALGTDDDPLSEFATAEMQRAGVIVDRIQHIVGYRPNHSTIIVSQSHNPSRTILVESSVHGAVGQCPNPEHIRDAAVLLVDDSQIDGAIRIARIARAAGVKVVADVENTEGSSPEELISLISQVDHLIVSNYFARQFTGQIDTVQATRALARIVGGELALVTCGANGGYIATRRTPDRVMKFPAFVVDAVDTTGAGDVMHGGYAAALILGCSPLEERVRFAAATVAMKIQTDGLDGFPTLAKVKAFLARRPEVTLSDV